MLCDPLSLVMTEVPHGGGHTFPVDERCDSLWNNTFPSPPVLELRGVDSVVYSVDFGVEEFGGAIVYLPAFVFDGDVRGEWDRTGGGGDDVDPVCTGNEFTTIGFYQWRWMTNSRRTNRGVNQSLSWMTFFRTDGRNA